MLRNLPRDIVNEIDTNNFWIKRSYNAELWRCNMIRCMVRASFGRNGLSNIVINHIGKVIVTNNRCNNNYNRIRSKTSCCKSIVFINNNATKRSWRWCKFCFWNCWRRIKKRCIKFTRRIGASNWFLIRYKIPEKYIWGNEINIPLSINNLVIGVQIVHWSSLRQLLCDNVKTVNILGTFTFNTFASITCYLCTHFSLWRMMWMMINRRKYHGSTNS